MPGNITIIFVAGAWHTEAHVQPLIPYLDRYNYRTVPIQLETSKQNRVSTEDNFGPICQAIEAEIAAGQEVCVLGHSVAGFSIAGAVAHFLKHATPEHSKKLVAIMFLAAFIMDPFRSTSEDYWFKIDWEAGNAVIVEPAGHIFYNDLTPEEARPYVDALNMNWVAMPPEELPVWWKEMKNHSARIAYFLCTRDRAVPSRFQHMEADEMGVKPIELDAGHCPMVDQPSALADAMHQVISTWSS